MRNVNSWKGLHPYSDELEDLRIHPFCGRNKATRDLFELVDNNIAVTLYGMSGMGKTSVLKAGLYPYLKKKYYEPIHIRLKEDNSGNENFSESIISKIENVCCNNQIRINSIREFEKNNHENSKYLINYFLNSRFSDSFDNEIFPVIIFDQFEEVLKSSEDLKKVEILMLQIRELINENIQFEHKDATINYRILISIREDDFYLLEDAIDKYHIEDLKRNRYRLQALTYEEATEIIQTPDNELFKSDEIEEITDSIIHIASPAFEKHINTQILSLCCYLLYEFAKSNGVEYKLNKKDINVLEGNLLVSFYNKAIIEAGLTNSQASNLEEKIITETGRRQTVSVKICKFIIGEGAFKVLSKGEYAILKEIRYHGEECVELIHDKLAHIIKNKRAHYKSKEINRKRRESTNNVLLPEGRTLNDNKFTDFTEDNPQSLRNTDMDFIKIQSKRFLKLEDISLKGILEQIPQDQNVVFLSFNGKQTLDGISSLKIEFDDNKKTIRSIFFYDSVYDTQDNNNKLKPFYTSEGFCGIKLKYEYRDGVYREISRTYCKEDAPIVTKDGYSTVKRYYESDEHFLFNLPDKTLYEDCNGTPCKHRDGNYGYLSKYDDDGNEVKRVFIDIEGNPCNIYNNVAKIYKKYINTLLVKCSFYDINNQPIYDFFGHHSVKYEYEENSERISSISYYDIEGNASVNKDNYHCEKIIYCGNRKVKNEYFDADFNKIERIDGSYTYHSLEYKECDSFSRPIIYNMFDIEGNLKYTLKIKFNEKGQIIQRSFYGPTGLPLLSEPERTYIETSTYDHLGRIISVKNFDTDKNPIVNCYDFHEVRISYNDFSQEVKREYFGIDGKNVDSTIGFSKLTTTYLKGDIVKWELYNAEGITLEQRKIVPDVFMNPVIEWVKKNGKDIVIRREYYQNKVISEAYYDSENLSKITVDEGYHCIKTNYNDDGSLSFTYYDRSGKITKNNDGYAFKIISNESSLERVWIVEKYYDENYQPTLFNNLYHIKKYTEKEFGIDIRKFQLFEFYDEKGHLCNCEDGFAKIECDCQIDEAQETTTYIFKIFNENNEIVDVDEIGWAILKAINYKSSNKEEAYYYDSNENPINLKEGFHKVIFKVKDSTFSYPYEQYYSIKFFGKNKERVEIYENELNVLYWHKKISTDNISYKLYDKSENVVLCKNNITYRLWNSFWRYTIAFLLYFTFIPINKIYLFFLDNIKRIYQRTTNIKNENFTEVNVINIAEIHNYWKDKDNDNVKCTIAKNIGLAVDDIVIKWDNWTFSRDADNIDNFESTFIKTSNQQDYIAIYIYRPSTGKYIKLNIKPQGIGVRLTNRIIPLSKELESDFYKEIE